MDSGAEEATMLFVDEVAAMENEIGVGGDWWSWCCC